MTIEQLLAELRQIREHAHFQQCDSSTLAAQLRAAIESFTGTSEADLPESLPKIGLSVAPAVQTLADEAST